MELAIMWFRRDLRLDDNAALYQALTSGKKVLPIFIFDTNILDNLEEKNDARVSFIYNSIRTIKLVLNKMGSDLLVLYGNPYECIEKVILKYKVSSIFLNRDYESYAVKRDNQIETLCSKYSVQYFSYKDHVIFESNEVRKDNNEPYVVYTPYRKKWMQKLKIKEENATSTFFKSYNCKKLYGHFIKQEPTKLVSLNKLGFKKSELIFPSSTVKDKLIVEYKKQRDFPNKNGTSRLGVHFRFGTISIREVSRKALQMSDVYLSELIWRDFYSMILQEFPRVEKEAFRQRYNRIVWRNNEKEFELWCKGLTGYPFVDAGMRELNSTGFMHNRVRMVAAGFLCKHLLIDWRWGEAYFSTKLLDYDLASNNGGWQWVAGCGTDAAPYFRIFNPETQRKKFDPQNIYVASFVPEFGTPAYPKPIVEHKFARERCIKTYKECLTGV